MTVKLPRTLLPWAPSARAWAGALALAALPRGAAAQDPPRRVDGELGARIAAFTEGAAAFGFSGAVLAAQRGRVVAALGAGAADLDGRRPNTANTLFEIASATKQFTAAAVLVLVQQKKVRLDDPINRHLPGVPDDCKAITVRHLLQHTSGIPGTNGRGSGDDLAAVLPSFLAGGPRHDPGTHWEYWNQGYALLAGIIERAAGERYTEFCRRQLFAKAGLETACFTGDEAPRGADAATGVSAKGAPRSALEHPYGSYGYQYRGMGGAVCSAWDLWRWDRALCGTKVLAAAAKKELFAPGLNDYALGWFVREEEGRRVQTHGGSVRGFLCDLRRYPDDDGFLCVLCNRTSGPFGQVVKGLEQVLSGARITVPAPLPVAAGRELVGTWVADRADRPGQGAAGAMRIAIEERDGVLHAEQSWAGSPDRVAVLRGALAGPDLDGLQLFDWREAMPVRVERAAGGAVAAIVFHGQRYRRT
jgi:CubicO group peptidase (beta-lactamase class C family)